MRRAIISTAAAVATFALLNAALLLFMDIARPSDHKFLKRYQKWLSDSEADIVLIGNSMLGAAVDQGALSRLLGKRCIKLAKGGSASAAWYLTFKNVIVAARRRPEHTVFFFRDSYLTRPDYRTTGTYRSYIDDQSTDNEPLLDALVFETDPNMRLLRQHIPAVAHRTRFKEMLGQFMKAHLLGSLTGLSKKEIEDAVNKAFHRREMLRTVATREQQRAETPEQASRQRFEQALHRSFLPHIISMAKEADIKLVFVRVKRRRDLRQNMQPPELRRYIANLDAYLESNNIPFIDFTSDERLEEFHYGDGDHLNYKEGRALFTEMLAEGLAPVLETE